MKKSIFIFIALLAFALLAAAESYRKTTSDMYMESYVATMRRQTGMSAAEVRAEEYRNHYEICDENHNCTNVTAGSPEETKARKIEMEKDAQTINPFLHTPIFQ